MQLMPPMTSSMAEPGLLSARPRNTNFSIAAIMSENKEEEDVEADQELEDSDEELEVGTEAGEDIAETSLETEEKVTPTVKKERKPKLMTGKSNCTDLDHIKCNLDNKDLWDKFCEFGTEMIITRTGRRMFPTVRCSFANLDLEPGTKYLILLDIVPCDNKRYRYAYHRSSWLVAGKADPAPPHRLYCHPDAPFTAEQLKKQVISFEKVKVTNNESDNTGQVNISIFTSSLLARKQILFLEFFALNDFFNHGGNLSQITTKTLSCGSLFAKEFKLSLRFYVRNLLEIKGFNCLAIVVLISFETPSLSPPAVSAETVSIYIPCLPKPFNEFSGELRLAMVCWRDKGL